MKSKLPLLLLISPMFVLAQSGTKQVLKGVVVSHPVQPDSVLVINKTKNIYVYSGKQGNFSITADVSDMLVFSASNYKDD
jgi:hypothetical protein